MQRHYGDLSDTSNLTRIIQEVQPDEIYNLGAQSHVAVSFESPEYTADVDGMGTLRLLEAIRILGLEYSVREFISKTAHQLGVALAFEGECVNEVAKVAAITGYNAPALAVGPSGGAHRPPLFPPHRGRNPVGRPQQSQKRPWLGARITLDEMVQEMVQEMVAHDPSKAKQHALLKKTRV